MGQYWSNHSHYRKEKFRENCLTTSPSKTCRAPENDKLCFITTCGERNTRSQAKFNLMMNLMKDYKYTEVQYEHFNLERGHEADLCNIMCQIMCIFVSNSFLSKKIHFILIFHHIEEIYSHNQN